MNPSEHEEGHIGILKDRFKGSAMGTFVGDALGRPVEGWSCQRIQASHGLLVEMLCGVYSDDTEMMIGIMESLAESPRFDPGLTAKRFLTNFSPHRGYGGRIYGVMDRLRCGADWNEAGTDSWGNGGAMRIAPIGFFFYDDPERLEAAARDCARITHHHPLGLAGALAQARAVGLATSKGIIRKPLEISEFVNTVVEVVAPTSAEMAEALTMVKRIVSGRDSRGTVERIVSHFPCDVSAIGAVPAALASVVLTQSFRESVVVAVNSGGDTDTIGAMAGAIAGAYYGFGQIPNEWLERLENGPKGRDYVVSLAERLADVKSQEKHGNVRC